MAGFNINQWDRAATDADQYATHLLDIVQKVVVVLKASGDDVSECPAMSEEEIVRQVADLLRVKHFQSLAR